LYAVGSRPILIPVDEAPVWNSPVFIPTARVRRKDQTLLSETVRQAVSDRWGPGSVFDWNPDGAVWDLVPDASGRYSRYFPPTPVLPYGRDWPESLDPGIWGSSNRGSRNFGTVPFGTAARFGASAPGTALIPAGTAQQAQDAARRTLERAIHPRETQVSASPASGNVLMVAGAAALAFGAGVLLGSWLKST
jgi:hypothetical protein